jgi:hypothetical protein
VTSAQALRGVKSVHGLQGDPVSAKGAYRKKIPVNDEIIRRLHLELVAAIELDCIQQMAMAIYCLENLFVLTLGSKGVYLPSRLYRHESHESPELLGNAAVNEICISYYRRRSCPNGDASDLNLQ